MNIGINGRYIQRKILTGIENYIFNLILNLKKTDKVNNYFIFFEKDRKIPDEFCCSTDNFKTVIPDFPTKNEIQRIFLNQFLMNSYIRNEKLDLFHEPFFASQFFKNCPTIITIYDISYYIHPEFFNFKTRMYFNFLVPRSIKRSDCIITISDSAKKDIVDYLKIDPDKIEVVYAGCDPFFHKINDEAGADKIKVKYKIFKDYILYVSYISPKKNLLNLINAFNIFRKEYKYDIKLVIAGGKGWNSEQVFELVKILKLEKEVIFTGHVPKEDLLVLYNYALSFVYPSIYEGFGIPILEAMACGCPVITAQSSSLPEISGNAALYVNPFDVEDISSAIFKLLDNDGLRKILIERGFENIKRFNWEQTAIKTLNIYKKFKHR